MTRDIQTLDTDDLNSNNTNDAAMYAALWAAAPFPRLPEDAPAEIKALTVEINDPRRVYTIHRAARRHEFQLLVERFIIQIRYGCQSKTCHTRTCFSHRKYQAGGTPVRRYNSTSARTLAVYMASQDNPEQALCLNPMNERQPEPRSSSPKSPKPQMKDVKVTKTAPDALRTNRLRDRSPKIITPHKIGGSESSHQVQTPRQTSGQRRGSVRAEQDVETRIRHLEEVHKIDHRSFVQAVFGTAAFKMVEWLAPRSMQKLSDSEPGASSKSEATQPEEQSIVNVHGDTATQSSKPATTVLNTTSEEAILPAQIDGCADVARQKDNHDSQASTQRPLIDTRPATSKPSITEDKPRLRRKNSHVRTSSDVLDYHSPRSILNLPPKPMEAENHNYTQLKPTKQKVVRQKLITSPPVRVNESPSPDAEQSPRLSVEPELSPTPAPPLEPVESKPELKNAEHELENVGVQKVTSHLEPHQSTPQSLSYLPAEVVLMICDILDDNNISEKHNLHPQRITNEISVEVVDRDIGSAAPWSFTVESKSRRMRHQWLGFAEQSFYDVLGRPESLLQSFRRDGKLFDNMSLWYLMLRMTRVAPSLVFDSLWRTSESLFIPPEVLRSTHDWAKRSSTTDVDIQTSLSNRDASHIISICLHALQAAAPLVQDSRKLMNMSRIRSYGLSTLGRDSTSLEPISLCVQYEDAFSCDAALRLARRLFAAIPIRRSFDELMEPHIDPKKYIYAEKDVLDLTLETLRLNMSVLPILGFSVEEMDTHETRGPTLILDWARTVMLQDWPGTAEVPAQGAFGGALMVVAAIYQNRKSLLLGDIHFRTQYFSDRLDPIATARQWSRFEPNKKTVHLLDHPYLFHPETLVTYFRAINYSRMNQAYETSKSSSGLMSTAMSHNSLMVQRHRRQALSEQMRTANSTSLVLEIRRSHVLLDAFNSIWRREERELLRPIKLRLGEDSGEEGLDLGGVQQEFFGLAMGEALDPNYGTFTIDDRTRMTWFQPGSFEPLWKFELIGTIISLAVYNGLTIPITFPRALYQRLLGEEVTELHHIQDGWPDLAAGLTTLLEWNEADGSVEDVFSRTYEFSVSQYGQNISRDMSTSTSWPQFSDVHSTANPEDAPSVTNENRNQYVSDYIRWLTDVSVRPQFEAFKRGFFTCLTPRSISLFDAPTLQSLIEGEQTIDISELRRTTRYMGWDASHRTIRDFWSIVKKFDLGQKRKLLEFVTASDRVPVGGMRNMQFTVQKNGEGDRLLPTSATCFGILLLPEYGSKEVMKEKLIMALENSKGFGTM